jgi:hypothetical protein
MKFQPRSRQALALLGPLLIAGWWACSNPVYSDSADAAGSSGGNTAAGGASSSGGAPATGGSAALGTGGGGSDGAGGVPAACNVPEIPQTIAPVLVGQGETATGGTLVDGLYHLVKFEVDDLEAAPDAVAIAVEIAGGSTIFRFAAQYGEQTFGQEYTVTTDDTNATITTICPESELGRISTSAYSSHDATLIFYSQDGVQTYTRL